MQVKVYQLQRMLEALTAKAGESLDWKGLQVITIDKLKISNEDYLYKRIHLKLQNKRPNDSIKLHPKNLDTIAKYLEFDTFKKYIQTIEASNDPLLLACVGNYYSYVRGNSKKTSTVLRSPVRIWREKGKILLELKGPRQTFTGEVQLKHGCLFVLMEAKSGKAFYHIYRIGTREEPKVLQGVFSGVSTAFDPIGGRAVLIRTDAPYISMKNATIDIPALKKSKQLEERRLAEYFKEYINNNIAPEKSYTFGLDDLGDCK